jgi:hypothetical protein
MHASIITRPGFSMDKKRGTIDLYRIFLVPWCLGGSIGSAVL